LFCSYDANDIKNLEFLGFVGFVDPLRSTSKSSIETCRRAGIRVIMITGDHPLTAKSISKELGLINDDSWVVSGSEIEEAYNNSKEKLVRLISEHDVFARVSPSQKSIIVETLNELGEFTAVTGEWNK